MPFPPPNIYEPARALSWLQSVLAPLASGGAWHGIAPVSTQPPFITYALSTASDLANVGAYRIWSDGLYQVKVCGPTTLSDTLFSIADAVDNALQRKSGVIVGVASDATMLFCDREQTLILPENVVNAGQWLNFISIYRIYIQAR